MILRRAVGAVVASSALSPSRLLPPLLDPTRRDAAAARPGASCVAHGRVVDRRPGARLICGFVAVLDGGDD